MARSKKKPYIQDKPRTFKRTTLYWRKIRRVIKNALRSGKEPPDPKIIINDYDFRDFRYLSPNKEDERK